VRPETKPTNNQIMKSKLSTWRNLAILTVLFVTPASLRADAITDWNAITVQATVTGARPGPTGVFDIATVHAAMYDAVQAIEKRFEPYFVSIPGASGSSAAAVAKAAHDVLVNRFPSQTAALDTAYAQYLSTNGLSATDHRVSGHCVS